MMREAAIASGVSSLEVDPPVDPDIAIPCAASTFNAAVMAFTS
jgi:hypothetical protein